MRETRSSGRKNKNDIIYIKPVIITSVVAIVLALIFVGGYYLLNARIGAKDLFKSNVLRITTSEENEQIFPITYKMKNLEGKEISVADEHKPAVITYFASWNNYSAKQVIELTELQKDYPDVRFLYVDIDEKESEIDTFLKENKLEIPKSDIIIDKNEKMFKTYGVKELPFTIFINTNGTVESIAEERIYKSAMEEIVDSMIDKMQDNTTPEPEDENGNNSGGSSGNNE